MTEEKRHEGVFESFNTWYDEGKFFDTIQLTFYNGEYSIKTPIFGNSSKNLHTKKIDPGLREI